MGILKAMEDGVCIVDRKDNIEYVNPAMEKEFGEVGGRKCFEYFLQDPHHCPSCKNNEIFSGKTVRWEWHSSGNNKYYDIFETPIKNSDGTISKLEIFHDITEQKKVLQQLIHTEKLSSIGTFVSGVAHELNTPLTSIYGFSQNLMDIETLSQEQKEEVQIILEQSRRAASIVKNLLKFSRKQKLGKAAVNINDVLENSLTLHVFSLSSDNIKVEKRFSKKLDPVYADFNELQQVFTNIILNAHNAMKDSPGGGTLTIKTEGNNSGITATFENTGPAIPGDALKNIFDPFFTTKGVGEGTGLGLYVSYQIIKDHGGNIFAENMEGSGVRFIVSLPAAMPISKELEPKTQPRVPKDIRVLVVDDDEPFRRWLSKYLLSEGVFVQLATNGKEALKHIEESDFDIVLSDIKMPEMDGYELGKWLQENKPEYLERFVLITGMIEKDVEDFCVRNDCKYMTKPVEREDILEMIHAVVG